MKISLKLICFEVCLCVAAVFCHVLVGTERYSDETKADRLVWQLDAAGAQLHLQRQMILSSLMGVGGALAMTGGVIIATASSDKWQNVGKVNLGIGLGALAIGGIFFLVPQPYEDGAAIFYRIQGKSSKARLAGYEGILSQLASEDRRSRITSTIAGLTIGSAAVIGGAFVDHSATDWGETLVTLGAICAGASIVNYSIPRFYESKWENYKKNGQIVERPTNLSFNVSPVPNGIITSLAVSLD